MPNQKSEQLDNDAIDRMLTTFDWQVQPNQKINIAVATGVAVQNYQTAIKPQDKLLDISSIPQKYFILQGMELYNFH